MRRKYKKVVALCTATTVAVGSLTACQGSSKSETTSNDKAVTDKENKTDTTTKTVRSSDGKEEKTETVYAKADAAGKVNDVTVSNWLLNGTGLESISDVSDLTNIKNIKGDEQFTNDGTKLNWSADGSDIYYQGTTTKALPVNVKITYTLDGNQIAPEDLAGKSGHLKIHFDYENTQKQTVDVNGKKEEVSVPFAVMTGTILDSSKFTNVKVDNGQVISDGDKMIVAGLAMPGLQESLLDGIDKKYTDDIDIPNSVEIEADVTDCSIDMTLSIVLNDLLNDVNTDDFNDLDDIKDKVKEMKDNFKKIVDGSSDLKDGVDKLSDVTGKLDSGAAALVDATSKLKDATGQLNDGTKQLSDNTSLLDSSVTKLNKGSDTLDKGASTLNSNSKQLTTGADTLIASLKKAANGSGKLSNGLGLLAENTKLLKDKIGNKKNGLAASVEQIKSGSATLVKGFQKGDGTKENPGAVSASKQLADGAGELKDGVDLLIQKVSDLKKDINQNIKDYTNYKKALASDKTKEATVKAILSSQDNEILGQYNKVLENMKSVDAGLAQLNQLPELSGDYLASYKDTVNKKVALTEGKTKIEEQVVGQVDGALKVLTTMKSQLDDKSLNDKLAKLEVGSDGLATNMSALKDGIKALSDGAATLDGYLGKLNTGAKELKTKTAELDAAVQTASKASATLDDGLNKLASAGGTLKKGLTTYTNGVATVAGGASSLAIAIDTLNSATGKLNTAT
ncbi:MAG: hypothetical protein Q4G58_14985, partial [bacterium]|nr:hypothetical protein [bacterium]